MSRIGDFWRARAAKEAELRAAHPTGFLHISPLKGGGHSTEVSVQNAARCLIEGGTHRLSTPEEIELLHQIYKENVLQDRAHELKRGQGILPPVRVGTVQR